MWVLGDWIGSVSRWRLSDLAEYAILDVASNWCAFTFKYPSDQAYPWRCLMFMSDGKVVFQKRADIGSQQVNIWVNQP